MKNLTLRQIRIFLSAAKHLSFSKAAEELHITAPAVSLQIKEMELDMGVALFVRENRKIELTSAGEYFLIYARRISSTLIEAASMMERLHGTQTGQIRVGLVSTAKYFLPRLLAQFKQDHPGIQIRFEVRNREQLVELLRDGGIDLAIMGRPPKEIDTRVEPFAPHPHCFIASPEHPLAKMDNIPPVAMNPFELISREQGSGTRFLMERFLDDNGASPIVSMEMSSNESIKQAVIANLGISFVSLHTLANELSLEQLVVLNVQGTPMVRTWHVVALSKRNATQAAESFRYFILEKGGQMLKSMFDGILPKTSDQ